ncbi:uncharacterized protein CYBJADRAFT_51069 [Cyberlindnera jadinii NRRL Y-1542]|uniref:Uncharacterized protein n=1 Tax=Cyberlindnera jadinii (strain ATCC 18201 / CBS 1600 / BCRC 20928 / JCM 3617 / NBRC 0987 / NRRL Y-1542) TaxID=983966 RepID=A0A1E4S822_CYBJN|nr:hypothetical protein CYBJADRAFT_51069 [Cyberlindnera jadinii NRRL Y-1542]ODV75646.1 hypothetical protein CYBJADRAFT_51069 [Cyberlindnera jadinii NRRL Y-1542]
MIAKLIYGRESVRYMGNSSLKIKILPSGKILRSIQRPFDRLLFPIITKKEQFKVGKRQRREMDNLEIMHDVKLHFNRLLRAFHLIIPVECKKNNIHDPRGKTVALDSGSTHFITEYSPAGGPFISHCAGRK